MSDEFDVTLTNESNITFLPCPTVQIKGVTKKVNFDDESSYFYTYERAFNNTRSDLRKKLLKRISDVPFHGKSAMRMVNKSTPPPNYTSHLD